MKFKARMRVSGDYLGDFMVNPNGEVLQRNSAGIHVRVDAELLPIIETKSFCEFCGARGKHE